VKPMRTFLILLSGFIVVGCVASRDGDMAATVTEDTADAAPYLIAGSSGHISVNFRLPADFHPLPQGPVLDSGFRSFIADSGSTIDVYLDGGSKNQSCMGQSCKIIRHKGWQQADPVEFIYPKGVLTLSKNFQRRDFQANLNKERSQETFSLKFVLKCIEGDSCTAARKAILQTVSIKFN
jgi:hypothetical protein